MRTSTALLSFDLAERRQAAAGPLAPLANALSDELAPWLDRPLPIPLHKARLTTIGGWCPNEGAMLTFDPNEPHAHRCPVCGTVQQGVEHDQYWAMGAQLWTAERAAQSAALHLLRGDAAHLHFTLRILAELGDRYEQWPNRDNVLGPSRPFFSTYLESIWLLNLCHAIALLEMAPLGADAQQALETARRLIIAPSASLIGTYHEGRSNRQVWNTVALMSAGRILGESDSSLLQAGPALFLDLQDSGLLSDGTWYEGENYHLFAHRGLWYGVELLRTLGLSLPAVHERKFAEGFISPFVGLLPDDTLPSRRDSKYAVSIHQWRFAEWCELGVSFLCRTARYPEQERALSGILSRLYTCDLPPGDSGRIRSTADAERREPPCALTRADLSWRALLCMCADAPVHDSWQPASACLPAQGLAVIRRDRGRVYVALEGGHTGGGHGHPDRLALTLQRDHTRWLEDPGTGSYVSRTLHWYRSSLAHAAPLLDGASQRAVPAVLVAFDDQGEAGWMVKRVVGLSDGVTMQRTIIVCDDYLVDLIEWTGSTPHSFDLQIARAAITNVTTWQGATPNSAGALEDGFDFLRDSECAPLPDPWLTLTVPGHSPHDARVLDRSDAEARAWYAVSGEASVWRATAPAPPECADRPLHWVHTTGTQGRVLGVWSWNDVVRDVAGEHAPAATPGTSPHDAAPPDATPVIAVTLRNGNVAHHARTSDTWRIDIESDTASGAATRRIELARNVDSATATDIVQDDASSHGEPVPWPALTAPPLAMSSVELRAMIPGELLDGALRLDLSREHYRQTELPWPDAGRPTASVQLGATDDALVLDVQAFTGAPNVPHDGAINRLDNERADVNADGIQLYVGTTRDTPWHAAWLIVPSIQSAPAARITALVPGSPPLDARWATTIQGWALQVVIAKALLPLDFEGAMAFDLIVNERGAGRERRQGQLVLSGGGGFAYLVGDRQEPARALHLLVT